MRRNNVLKRCFTAMLIASLALCSFTGCAKKSTDTDKENTTATSTEAKKENTTEKTATESTTEEPVTIRVCWWGNQTRNDATVKALDMYEAEHPNVHFEVEFSDWSGYWDKLATQAAGGNLPDIIQMDYAYISQYVESELLVGMNSFIDSNIIDTTNIPDSIMSSGRLNGEVYGICAGIQSKALLVNTDVMNEAGVTLSKQPTYEELFAAAKRIYEKTGQQIEIPSNDEQSMLFLARAVGQTMYNEAGDGLGMPDDTVALRYFTMLKDTLDEGYHVSPEAMAEASTNQQSMFASGKEWCGFANSNQITNTINQCEEGLNYEIYMYPTEANATQQPLFLKPSMFFSITRDSEHADIAADVINYLTNSVEANQEALKGERGVPISDVVSEAIASVVDESTARINAYVTEVAKVATEIDPPFPAASAEVGKLISDLADAVRYREVTPEEAAVEFYKSATEMLQRGAQS